MKSIFNRVKTIDSRPVENDSIGLPPQKPTSKTGALIFLAFIILAVFTVLVMGSGSTQRVDGIIVDKKILEYDKSYGGIFKQHVVKYTWIVKVKAITSKNITKKAADNAPNLELLVDEAVYGSKEIGLRVQADVSKNKVTKLVDKKSDINETIEPAPEDSPEDASTNKNKPKSEQ